MAGKSDFAWLLRQLGSAASPLERMRLLSRAWRAIRAMSPGERTSLASRIGIDGAGELIEKLASGRKGISPKAVQRVLERVRETDPDSLTRALRELREPEGRGRLLERGVEALAGTAGEPPDDEGAETGETGRPEPESGAGARANAGDEEPPPRPAPAPPPRAVARPEPVVRESRPAPPVPPVPASPSPPERRTEAAHPRPRNAEAPEPRPPSGASSETAAADQTLCRRIEAAGGLSARFRVLREHLTEARILDVEGLRDLVDRFGPGWARRRVVDMLLRAGIPAGLHQAVFLIEHLDAAIDRRWCAGTLICSRPMPPDDRRALEQRHRAFDRQLAG